MRPTVLIVDDHAEFRASASGCSNRRASTWSGGRRRGSGNRRERSAQAGGARRAPEYHVRASHASL